MEKHPRAGPGGEGVLGAASVLWVHSQRATEMIFSSSSNLSPYRVPGMEQGPWIG